MPSSTSSTDEASLEDLDRQLDDAVNFCISSGMSPAKISECAEPIIHCANKKKRQRTLRWLLKMSIVVALIAVLWGNESCFRWFCIGCKLIQLKLLPYWDWTDLHEINCMISNPYYVHETISAEDCKWCEQYPDVHRLKSLSHDVMTNDYLLKNLPVIVTDTAQGQAAATHTLSFKELQKMYLKEDVYKDCLGCRFESSIGDSNMTDFLTNLLSHNSFNAHWFNCEFHCMKAFRKFHQRPYFIPPMVGISEENFVLVGQKKTGIDDDLIITQSLIGSGSIIWITQIKGQFHITLKSECGCDRIEEILQEGETLAFTGKTWWFTFKAVGKGEVIAVGASGNWD